MEHGGQVWGTCLYGHRAGRKSKERVLSKMVKLRETRQKTRDDECKDSSTLKQKTGDKIIEVVRGKRLKLVI